MASNGERVISSLLVVLAWITPKTPPTTHENDASPVPDPEHTDHGRKNGTAPHAARFPPRLRPRAPPDLVRNPRRY